MWGRSVVLLTSLLVGTACTHPIPLTSDHVEATEMLVRDSAGTTIATTADNLRWIGGPVTTSIDRPLPLRIALLDLQGREFDLTARPGFSIRIEVGDGVSASWEPMGTWGYLHPNKVGETTLRFMVWHGDHPDFISPWMPLLIAASPSAARGPQ